MQTNTDDYEPAPLDSISYDETAKRLLEILNDSEQPIFIKQFDIMALIDEFYQLGQTEGYETQQQINLSTQSRIAMHAYHIYKAKTHAELDDAVCFYLDYIDEVSYPKETYAESATRLNDDILLIAEDRYWKIESDNKE